MTTKCIELEYPFDGRRKATIITNNKQVCKYLAENPDGEIGITIGEKDEIKFIIKPQMLRNPKLAIKIIADQIKMICGDCYIEAPKGYLNKEDLE
jgi:hypothetical protein